MNSSFLLFEILRTTSLRVVRIVQTNIFFPIGFITLFQPISSSVFTHCFILPCCFYYYFSSFLVLKSQDDSFTFSFPLFVIFSYIFSSNITNFFFLLHFLFQFLSLCSFFLSFFLSPLSFFFLFYPFF